MINRSRNVSAKAKPLLQAEFRFDFQLYIKQPELETLRISLTGVKTVVHYVKNYCIRSLIHMVSYRNNGSQYRISHMIKWFIGDLLVHRISIQFTSCLADTIDILTIIQSRVKTKKYVEKHFFYYTVVQIYCDNTNY